MFSRIPFATSLLKQGDGSKVVAEPPRLKPFDTIEGSSKHGLSWIFLAGIDYSVRLAPN